MYIWTRDNASALMSARCIFIFMLIERRVVFRIYIKHRLFTRLLSSSSLPPSVHKVLLLACSSVYCLLHSIYLILFFSSLVALCLCRPNICLLSLLLSCIHSIFLFLFQIKVFSKNISIYFIAYDFVRVLISWIIKMYATATDSNGNLFYLKVCRILCWNWIHE
jgi:hypothetical protein